VCMLRVKKKS